MRTVRGMVSDEAGGEFPAGVAHVRLLDVSLADAPSVTLAEVDVPVGLPAAPMGVPFELSVADEEISETARYSVQVHVDVGGTGGGVKPGDYTTVRSYPVLTHGFGGEVEVVVRRVAWEPL